MTPRIRRIDPPRHVAKERYKAILNACTQAINENQAEFHTFFDCLIAFEFVKYLKGEEYVLKILV